MTHISTITIIGILIYLYPNAATSQLYSPFEMHEGMKVAYETVKGWHGDDVEMIFVNANYIQATHEQIDVISGKSVNWVYEYYDPRGDTAIIVLVRKYTNGTYYKYSVAKYLPVARSELDSIKITGYIAAPDSVILSMRRNGLSAFIAMHPDFKTMLFEARGRTRSWVGSFVSKDDTLTCMADLYTGQCIGCSESAVADITTTYAARTVELLAITPNPISLHNDAEMIVSFEIVQPADVHIAVYDINGKEVVVLAKCLMNPGVQSLKMPMSYIAVPGAYVVKLAAGQQFMTQKIVVIE